MGSSPGDLLWKSRRGRTMADPYIAQRTRGSRMNLCQLAVTQRFDSVHWVQWYDVVHVLKYLGLHTCKSSSAFLDLNEDFI